MKLRIARKIVVGLHKQYHSSRARSAFRRLCKGKELRKQKFYEEFVLEFKRLDSTYPVHYWQNRKLRRAFQRMV